MSRKHFKKYPQKYYLFSSAAIAVMMLYACSTTKKVPDGEFLLSKNTFKYTDGRIFDDEIPSYTLQKPNKKTFYLFPVGLWAYNAANPKYDSILNEYMTYPSEIRNQRLRDSLFVKYGHPEYKGRTIFWDRFFHTIGAPPVILEQGKTQKGAENIRKFLVYRGYWDADVKFKNNLDSAAKKAKVDYLITHKDPTYIKDYYYNIPDRGIKSIYEEKLAESIVKGKDILNQKNLEAEISRVNDLMRSRGYYKFNASGEEIYFTADSLQSRKQVPVTMEIHKDSADSKPYRKATIDSVKVFLTNAIKDTLDVKRDSLRGGVYTYRMDNQYKSRALWLPVIMKKGDLYNPQNFDLTKRNFIAMNNFNVTTKIVQRDSLLTPQYYLTPLPKYELKLATDVNYSQILNLAAAPSVSLTSRNVFGGAENVTFGLGGTFGTVTDTKDDNKKVFAYEISSQLGMSFPRLLLPFKYYKIIPKRFSPTSSINLGASIQNNIGLGRTNFTASLNYYANVNDIVSHKLSLFNTQFSFTRNKDKYYDFFPNDNVIRQQMYDTYAAYNPGYNMTQTWDKISADIVHDEGFNNSLNPSQKNLMNEFRQSLANKDRQTQDVLISSVMYNFIYNEIGKKDYSNPFYFNGKIEVAGNIFSLLNAKKQQDGVIGGTARTIFNIPYSQFVKLDFDFRKYFTFFDGKQTLAIRQFVGIGIPYGNSKNMPFVRSYFNGGSNDIRAWRVYGGLGPSDSQLDERVRSYAMDNVKLTTSVEYRIPINKMFEGAVFTDAGNIWSLKDNGFGDQFKFGKFISQMGVGSGLGLRINVAYVTLRLDAAYKMYDPNRPTGTRWVISKIQPLKPTLNFAFGYPF